ncbi:MAG: dimethylsulfonioproprionate lyase family protein [Pseudomonadota bacterium]
MAAVDAELTTPTAAAAADARADANADNSAEANAETTQEPQPKLFEAPDWLYLLREFDTLYRHGSAGGSPVIRRHRKGVREALSAVITANPELRSREYLPKPVTAHFSRALDLGERGSMQGLVRALRPLRKSLTWEYGYERVPKALSKKYAYCEVLGPRGPVPSRWLILGFVLFAPRTTYPQHSHDGIEESYISLAGAWSENDTAVYSPGSLILNRSGEVHRITTGDYDPCLLAYAWTGATERLTIPNMRLSKKRTPKAAPGTTKS